LPATGSQCVYSAYETDAFAAAVGGLPEWLGLACVRAEPAIPLPAALRLGQAL